MPLFDEIPRRIAFQYPLWEEYDPYHAYVQGHDGRYYKTRVTVYRGLSKEDQKKLVIWLEKTWAKTWEIITTEAYGSPKKDKYRKI